MAEENSGMEDAYFEKPTRLETWSGLPVSDKYTPEDVEQIDYQKEIADPGQYPYTRGIHPDMYRGKYWTRREVCGYGTASDTNKRLKFQMAEGVGGLNVILDIPSHMGIDPDHPRAFDEIGVTGCNFCSLEDMEDLVDGIAIDKTSMSLITTSCSTPVILAQYLVVAEKRGIDPSTLRGTIQNDPVHFRYCGFRTAVPLKLALKTGVDSIEYTARNMPHWYNTTVNMYDLREQGIDAPQEVAFGLGMAMCYIDGALERGLKIDQFAPRMAFYCSSHVDFFEEVAKLRAARKLWAKILKEKYGAQDPRSLKFRFAVHTAGCSLVPQQPLNNIIRVAYQAMAAVLAGVQSLHCCSYDEPIALPTEDAQLLALRTQQILAYETGVARVADPLGGSYYVESLTGVIEKKAEEILARIEELGGMYEAMRTEWIDKEMEKAALKRQKELEESKQIAVGVNAFVSEAEKETPGGVHRIPAETTEIQVKRVRELKERRDNTKVKNALEAVSRKADQGEKANLMPEIIDAVKAYATLGEIVGTMREAYGYSYDPLKVIENPFK